MRKSCLPSKQTIISDKYQAKFMCSVLSYFIWYFYMISPEDKSFLVESQKYFGLLVLRLFTPKQVTSHLFLRLHNGISQVNGQSLKLMCARGTQVTLMLLRFWFTIFQLQHIYIINLNVFTLKVLSAFWKA